MLPRVPIRASESESPENSEEATPGENTFTTPGSFRAPESVARTRNAKRFGDANASPHGTDEPEASAPDSGSVPPRAV